jgi:hypothetical protein
VRRALRAAALCVAVLAPACATAVDVRPDCQGEDRVLTLAAQAVPSATLIPCIQGLVSGWYFEGAQIIEGSMRFWLGSDRAGVRAVAVDLSESCDLSGAVEVIPGVDEAGTRRFEEPMSLTPSYTANRYYTFEGGCVTIEYRFGSSDSALVLQADLALSFRPRQELVERLDDLGLVLCGAGAPECPGAE